MNTTQYNFRYLAQIKLELSTPLTIGSGNKLFETDSAVAVDANGLPYIPGTAIAGVLRSLMGRTQSDPLFGSDKDNGTGSLITISEARLIDSNGNVADGIVGTDRISQDPVLSIYAALPIRQHVRINHRGVSDEESHGKFDEQVVYQGTRFCFEMECLGTGTEEDKNRFQQVVSMLSHPGFRLGGGTRKGFGSVKIIDEQIVFLDLSDSNQCSRYLNKSAALGGDFWLNEMKNTEHKILANGWVLYKLQLTPDDFIFFGSGLGDDEVDMAPVKEPVVAWTESGAEIHECFVIPATSIKGALSHRFCYHWNKKMGYTYGHPNALTGEKNPAVRTLFGAAKEGMSRGHVIISDVMIKDNVRAYVNSHLAVDRFTGSAMAGALFYEKNIYANGITFEIPIAVEESALSDVNIVNAFEEALKDVCCGLLPLGGGVNRGNGVFSGKLMKNEEVIYE